MHGDRTDYILVKIPWWWKPKTKDLLGKTETICYITKPKRRFRKIEAKALERIKPLRPQENYCLLVEKWKDGRVFRKFRYRFFIDWLETDPETDKIVLHTLKVQDLFE